MKEGIGLDPQQLAFEITHAAANRGALDLVVLDMTKLTTVCDYFIICHGRSSIHCQAISEEIQEHLEKEGIKPTHREGVKEATWILLDYLHVVVHIFDEETREFYGLERLWADAEALAVPGLE